MVLLGVAAVIVTLVLLLFVDHRSSPAASATNAPEILVHASDFKLRIEHPRRVHPGRTTFRLVNKGPGRHEMIVVRAGRNLPMRTDGLTVNEERLDIIGLDAIEPLKPASSEAINVRLEPGRYQIFCNMAGHYLGGMRAVLRVGT